MTNVAILGAGGIARKMAETLRLMKARGDGVELYAVGSRDKARAEAFAREEGFHALADAFAAVAKIEKSHEDRYVKLAENLSNSEVFKRAEVKVWYCRNCGHLEYGTEAPKVCPVCAHPQAYFELKAENY